MRTSRKVLAIALSLLVAALVAACRPGAGPIEEGFASQIQEKNEADHEKPGSQLKDEAIESNNESESEIIGEVTKQGESVWAVDGIEFKVTEDTEIDAELTDVIMLGDLVKVHLVRDNEGAFVAREIELFDDDPDDGDDDLESEIIGELTKQDGSVWAVDGIEFKVTEDTEIEDVIVLGDLVKVHLVRDNEGAFVAREIELFDDDPEDDDDDLESEFIGELTKQDGSVWAIDGIEFNVTEDTEIEDVIVLGDLVKVHLARDYEGALVAREIELFDPVDDSDDDSDDDDSDEDDLDDDDSDDDSDDDDSDEDDSDDDDSDDDDSDDDDSDDDSDDDDSDDDD